VEPPVPIDGRSYIGVRGEGEFLLEVKDTSDSAFIPKVPIKLSPGKTTYVDIPPNKRNARIMAIAITDYTHDVDIEDIFMADSR